MKTVTQRKCFIYARKSQESEDRQIQSIDDQIRFMKEVAVREEIEIVDIISEAKSAKIPNQRARFNEMIRRIQSGEANLILCWHMNRLSRNPLESGVIQQLLEDGKITSIFTYANRYNSEDNVIGISIESAQAAQYSKELSVNVKRGLKSRVEKGLYPGRAPMGYINDKFSGDIVPDSERFDLVRKMWDLALTGKYSQQQIADIANNEWGFRTLKRRRLGGGKVAKSTMYKMFGNVFYAGQMLYAGQVYTHAQHVPMVTLEEFDRVQDIFGKTNRPRSPQLTHAFSGLIQCDCGRMYTGYTREKTFKRTSNTREYTYYRCSRNKKVLDGEIICSARPITLKGLEEGILNELDKMAIDKQFLDWAFETIDENTEKVEKFGLKVEKTKETSAEEVRVQRDRLKTLFLRGHISEDEFTKDKTRMDEEIARLEEKQRVATDYRQKKDALKDEFRFMAEAKRLLQEGSKEIKNEILRHFGTAHRLSGGKFHLEPCIWVKKVQTSYKKLEKQLQEFGPVENVENQRRNADLEAIRLAWCGQRESNSRLILGKDSLYHLTMAASGLHYLILFSLNGQSKPGVSSLPKRR